jgi:hypothetical protein
MFLAGFVDTKGGRTERRRGENYVIVRVKISFMAPYFKRGLGSARSYSSLGYVVEWALVRG